MNKKYSNGYKQCMIEAYLSGKPVQALCSESGVLQVHYPTKLKSTKD